MPSLRIPCSSSTAPDTDTFAHVIGPIGDTLLKPLSMSDMKIERIIVPWVIRGGSVSERTLDTDQRWIRLDSCSNNTFLPCMAKHKVDFPNLLRLTGCQKPIRRRIHRRAHSGTTEAISFVPILAQFHISHGEVLAMCPSMVLITYANCIRVGMKDDEEQGIRSWEEFNI
jgi:hypothetical protein